MNVNISSRTGCFNFANPGEEVSVEIPAADFDHTFTVPPDESVPEAWPDALEHLADRQYKHIGDNKARDDLNEVLNENLEDIEEAYEQYRAQQIDQEMQRLARERRELSR